jgi:2-polyprenyl-6-methoxyphenol hydroxylase-like FAD-dependent oxidoreductase
MSTGPVNVLIVGAGPVGLTLACHLRKLGLSFRLVEKRTGPSQHSKAIGLQYRVSEILARLGVVDRFIARGASPTVVNIHVTRDQTVRLEFVARRGVSGREAFRPRALVLPQTETESLLIDYLDELGAAVDWGTEFLDYAEHADGVVAHLRHGSTTEVFEAQWLVSCEGAHSVIRKQARISFGGKTYPLAFVMADVRLDGELSHMENHVWLHPDGSVAALPLPAPDVWRLFVEVTRESRNDTTAPDISLVRRLLQSRAPDMRATVTGEPLWLSDFRINCRLVDRMQDGRVLLAGDAAHIHSPTGGQGITTGMQDAVNLAWKLARVAGGAPRALLSTYDEERRPHAAEVLRETARTTNLLFAPSLPLRILRDYAVLPLLRRAWVQRRLFGKLSQLHVHYRDSSLSEDARRAWSRRRLRAGDRAPDVVFRRRDGSRTTLFDLMKPLNPVVLFNGTSAMPDLNRQLEGLDIDGYSVAPQFRTQPEPTCDLIDHTGDFAALYGLTKDFLCLVRPDGHIGFVGAPRDAKRFHRYLARLCNPEAFTSNSLPRPVTPSTSEGDLRPTRDEGC